MAGCKAHRYSCKCWRPNGASSAPLEPQSTSVQQFKGTDILVFIYIWITDARHVANFGFLWDYLDGFIYDFCLLCSCRFTINRTRSSRQQVRWSIIDRVHMGRREDQGTRQGRADFRSDSELGVGSDSPLGELVCCSGFVADVKTKERIENRERKRWRIWPHMSCDIPALLVVGWCCEKCERCCRCCCCAPPAHAVCAIRFFKTPVSEMNPPYLQTAMPTSSIAPGGIVKSINLKCLRCVGSAMQQGSLKERMHDCILYRHEVWLD